MGKYIKSHSNYVINEKHQTTNDGTIYERDITTIGGRDRFTPGQVPIYRSGNFLITTNGEVQNSYKIGVNASWESVNGDKNDVWTLNTLSANSIDESASNDNSIQVKQDIHDLTDYAYWGSCSELFRASVGDILNKFPGEYYLPYNNVSTYTRNWSYSAVTDNSADLNEIVKATNTNKWYYLETGEEYDTSKGTSGKTVSGSDVFFSIDEILSNETISGSVVDGHVKTGVTTISNIKAVIGDDIEVNLPDVKYYWGNGSGDCPVTEMVGISGFYNKNADATPFKLTTYTVEKSLTIDELRIDGTLYEIEVNNTQSGITMNGEFRPVTDISCDDGHVSVILGKTATFNMGGTTATGDIIYHRQASIFDRNSYGVMYSGAYFEITKYDEDGKSIHLKRGGAGNEFEGIVNDPGFLFNLPIVYENTFECYGVKDQNGKMHYYRIDNFDEIKVNPAIDVVTPSEHTLYLLDNPFKLDMLRLDEPKDGENPLKYLRTNDNYKNYQAIDEDGNTYEIDFTVNFLAAYLGKQDVFLTTPSSNNIQVESDSAEEMILENGVAVSGEYQIFGEWDENTNYCPGDLLAVIKMKLHDTNFETHLTDLNEGADSREISSLNDENNELVTVDRSTQTSILGEFPIYAFIGDDGEIVYLVNFDEVSDYLGIHIRPKQDCVVDYYYSLDSFEQLLVNFTSTPLHTAQFNIIDEDETGYYTHNEFITFPVGNGGYNLAIDGPAYGLYLERLTEIGEFYDNRFSDNIWRSMTHEAIKNLDWSQSKGDDETVSQGYEDGFGKMEKTVRLMGRYFDSIRVYVESLKETNSIGYGDNSLLPDYFMSDKLNEFGWDTTQVLPYKLNIWWTKNQTCLKDEDLTVDEQKKNKKDDYPIVRKFYIDSPKEPIVPYSPYDENGNDRTYMDVYDCSGDLVPWDDNERDIKADDETGYFARAIKKYGSNLEYTYPEVNIEFLKRLALNSKLILRKKGTINGIESILAMFGMRSKDFAEKTNSDNYDFEIKEYVIRVDKPIIDSTDSFTGNEFLYDHINSLKDIVYDTAEYRNGINVPYEGLPVIYYEKLDDNGKNTRFLYPNFDSYETYDGNPYYQMMGGWMQKSPYTFDVDGNVVSTDITDRIYSETAKDIKTVESIWELISIPYYDLNNGDIVRVKDTTGLYVIVDGVVYELIKDETESITQYYFSVTVDGSYVTIGNTIFEDTITVSDPHYSTGKKKYILSDDTMNGEDIRIYVNIYDDNQNILQAYSNIRSITRVTLYDGTIEDDDLTDYFVINNAYSAGEISDNGWRRIRTNDEEYFIINNLRNNYNGNNPHKGNMKYDSGEEYFSYFTKLFKYPLENNHFSERLYEEYGEEAESIAESFGFSISGSDVSNECGFSYGDSLREGNGQDENTKYYDKHKILVECDQYVNNAARSSVELPTMSYMGDDSLNLTYGKIGLFGDRVINTKVIDIVFYLRASFETESEYEGNEIFTEDGQCMVKYIEDVIMPYLSQMIPSSTICRVSYKAITNSNG